MLLAECRKARVEIKTNCTVVRVHREAAFKIETNHGTFNAERLVIACGGLSFPKIGASDLGYKLARQFGLRIVETRPSLVALVLQGGHFGSGLASSRTRSGRGWGENQAKHERGRRQNHPRP